MSLYLPPPPQINFWMIEPIIMAPGPISSVYFINLTHHFICLYVYPPFIARYWLSKNPHIVARQRLSKNVTSATMHTIIQELFDVPLLCNPCHIKESMPSVLPTTFCLYLFPHIYKCSFFVICCKYLISSVLLVQCHMKCVTPFITIQLCGAGIILEKPPVIYLKNFPKFINPNFHYLVCRSSQLVPVLSYINPIHTTPSYFSQDPPFITN
jgi:hypothetical protein